MARKIIDIGIVGNDGTGDSIRDSFSKVNDNFRELYSSLGLGERLTFLGLADAPGGGEALNYDGQSNAIIGVNEDLTGLEFKQITSGVGISVNPVGRNLEINAEFSALVGDTSPRLGGDLRARSGGEAGETQWRIRDLPEYDFNDRDSPGGPIYNNEAASKGYVDSKISRGGVDAIDPRTNLPNSAFGTMTGPLILARNPIPEDDEVFNGLIAATKAYVDGSAFGSSVNLYVATSGQDDRVGVSRDLQGRALAYAYRTIEAACKRAEEIIKESRKEIGPYKKVLTYNEGEGNCYLRGIDTAPESGSGFSGIATMSVSTATIENVGVNYNIGDIITVVGGVYSDPARFQVLSTTSTPGGVVTFRTLAAGVYTELPGTLTELGRKVSTTSNSIIASGVELNLTFYVNNVTVVEPGSGFGLVSVRIAPAATDLTGSGAFGTASVVDGEIESVSVTDGGSGFVEIPTVIVNLPRFRIYTAGYNTDFTGDVSTDTPLAVRGRDIKEGLYLRGETSGALAQILAHTGELDSEGNELFDVDIIYGQFIEDNAETGTPGEVISYGDVTIENHITILVESGIYEENLPLRVPQNTTIFGDDFRRVIVRPKVGISSSPWANLYFRRDLEIDGNITASREFGYHYLSDSSNPVYSRSIINNPGNFRAAARLIEINREFIQQQIVNWIDYQIANAIDPFTLAFTYNRNLCQRDVGLIIDSMVFDLRYGESDRTISAALKYRSNNSALLAITTQKDETRAAIERINVLTQMIVRNVEITELYGTIVYPQVIERSLIAESPTYGSQYTISNITFDGDIVITTSSAHGLTTGDRVYFTDVVDAAGTEFLNGNDFYVSVISSTSFGISNVESLDPLITENDVSVSTYEASSGKVVTYSGIISRLIDCILYLTDVDNSEAINFPKENDQMDVFLANDACRWQGVSAQGMGGFALTLDPYGQILAKSPYAQECASFSKSTGRKTFAGGMFIDGFVGNVKFQFLGKFVLPAVSMTRGKSYTILDAGTTDFTAVGATNNDSGTIFDFDDNDGDIIVTGNGTVYDNSRLLIGGLYRRPQLPASFIVQDTVYKINYIRDFEFNVNGSTATLILDETTPWLTLPIEYNDDICYRDVGLILDGLGYDIVLETNYNTRRSAFAYRAASAAQVLSNQLEITIRALNYAHDLAFDQVESIGIAENAVTTSKSTIANVVRNGATFAPALNITLPTGLDSNLAYAKNQLANNLAFLVAETIGWVNDTYPGLAYSFLKWNTRFGYFIEALQYDIVYGGNSKSVYEALSLYDGVGDTVSWQLDTGTEGEFASAVGYLSSIAQLIVQDTEPPVRYTSAVRSSGDAASASEASTISTLLGYISTITVSGVGSAPTIILPDLDAYPYSTSLITARSNILTEKTAIQQSVVAFVDENINVYEVLTPGNRSMLANDFTQVNDLGYGCITANGGLAELVSMFTYYNHISYYSATGGQIRAVSGSSAHGNYALVADGYDPLEIPTPVNLYHKLSQGALVYAETGYENIAGGATLYISDFSYVPLNQSELEIDFGYAVYNYSVTNASIDTRNSNIVRLTIRDDSNVNLIAPLATGHPVTIRQNGQVVLTGDIVDVTTRPSTGLILADAADVYRVLEFRAYTDPNGPYPCVISTGSPSIITRENHGLEPGYQINFVEPIASFEASISGTTLTVSTLVSGVIAVGMILTSDNMTESTEITEFVSGTEGGVGIYTVNVSQTVSLEPMIGTGGLAGSIELTDVFYVLADDFTDDSFLISRTKNGTAISITGVGIGRQEYNVYGLARTTLRENYNYVELRPYGAQPYDETTVQSGITISVGGVCVITTPSAHGFVNGDAIRFDSTGILPTGLIEGATYWVASVVSSTEFTVIDEVGTSVEVETEGIQTGIHTVGAILGRVGDSEFGISQVADDEARIIGYKFVWQAVEYTVIGYDAPAITGEPYALLEIDPPLQHAVNQYNGFPTLKAGTNAGQSGTLTIRIALVRVTGHDLLEIGTGSYADTNYPNEIYGQSVNSFSQSQETEERTVGRVFYVTTDQFGNFRVGPYFSVDQGTGDVEIAATITFSNLEGLGFRRGVAIAEFSDDDEFARGDTDVVPVEFAIRGYIEKRLGITHTGGVVPATELLPTVNSGFMSLDGQLGMKNNMNLNNNRILNVTDPLLGQDAVNLRSLKWNNFQDFTGTGIKANDIIVFTGDNQESINAEVVGDITFGIDSTLNTVDAQINPEVILNADINPSAGIEQSKLLMERAKIVSSSTGLFGIDDDTGQDSRGLAAFTSSQFVEDVELTFTGGTVTLAAGTVLYQGTGSTPRGIVANSVSASTTVVVRTTDTFTIAGTAIYSATYTAGAEGSKSIITGVSISNVKRSGFISIKDRSISISKLAQLGTDTVIGRATAGTGDVEAVSFGDVVDQGLAVKKSNFNSVGFLRRKNATSFSGDTGPAATDSFEIIDATANNTANYLVQRDSSGDFAGNVITASELKVDGILFANTTTASPGVGYMNIYNYAGQTTMQLGSGSGQNLNIYSNAEHKFTEIGSGTLAPVYTGTLNCTAITGNTVGTNTVMTGTFTLGTSSTLQATYADLAEYYEADKEYNVGHVLIFGGDKEVTATSKQNDHRVAGVVSDNAAYIMNQDCQGIKTLIALQGRVPCRVVGKISKGDLMVTSSIEGVAISAGGDAKAGTIIGKALENYDSDHIGTIEVAVGRA